MARPLRIEYSGAYYHVINREGSKEGSKGSKGSHLKY